MVRIGTLAIEAGVAQEVDGCCGQQEERGSEFYQVVAWRLCGVRPRAPGL